MILAELEGPASVALGARQPSPAEPHPWEVICEPVHFQPVIKRAERVLKSLALAIKTGLNSITFQEVLQRMLADLPLHAPQDKIHGRTSAKVNVIEKSQPASMKKTTTKTGNWEMPPEHKR